MSEEIPKGNLPNTSISVDDKKKVIEEATGMFQDGVNKMEISRILSAKYDANISPNSVMLRQAKHNSVAAYVVPEKEHYFKDSLMQYEDITDEIGNIPERDKALKLQLTALKDRNELLGLAKSAVNIEINFEGKNYDDEDFLKDRNTIDVEVESK